MSPQVARDPCQVFGVPYNSTPDEFKRAYRSLIKKYHPDKGGDADKFIEVQEAWKQIQDSINFESPNGNGNSHGATSTSSTKPKAPTSAVNPKDLFTQVGDISARLMMSCQLWNTSIDVYFMQGNKAQYLVMQGTEKRIFRNIDSILSNFDFTKVSHVVFGKETGVGFMSDFDTDLRRLQTEVWHRFFKKF